MRSMKLLVCLLFLGLFCRISNAQNCTLNESNATYNFTSSREDNCSESNIDENCTVSKECDNGFTSPTHGMNLTCIANDTTELIWDSEDKPCTECDTPYYGINCTEKVGICSTVCPYNTTHGCANNNDTSKEIVCDLKDLHLTVKNNTLSGIMRVSMSLRIEAYVNVIDNDVEVEATFGGESTRLNATNDNLTYVMDVPIETESDGEYNITAKTSASEQYEIVTVVITDPVKNTRIYDSDLQIVAGSKIVKTKSDNTTIKLSCKAEGRPKPEINWYYSGIVIGTFKLDGKLYQLKNDSNDTESTSTLFIHHAIPSGVAGTYACQARNEDRFKNTFIDVLTVTVTEEVVDVEYAKRVDFLIASGVLGALLFITIIVFSVVTMKLRKKNGDFKERSKDTGHNKYKPEADNGMGRGNDSRETSQLPRTEMEPVSPRVIDRPQASLPKRQQKKITDNNPPDPGARQFSPLMGTTTHRPADVNGFPGTSGYSAARRNPGFQGDSQIYDQPGDMYEKSMPEPLPPRNPPRNLDQHPVYDEPPRDGVYETTFAFPTNG